MDLSDLKLQILQMEGQPSLAGLDAEVKDILKQKGRFHEVVQDLQACAFGIFLQGTVGSVSPGSIPDDSIQ